MATTDLCYLTATEALALFRKKKLSPVELMQAVIKRAEQTEPKVNALPMRYFDEAMDQAKAAEAVYARRGAKPRALEGIPFVVKDESMIQGRTTTFGSLIYKDAVDPETNPTIERILKAGAIVHARGATPEFSCAPYTHSRIWGITRTPWNLDYSPGGSSGGSGASLAAGSTILANGSDIGGSIRIPASMTGTVGYKPPFGRNPDSAPFNLDQYCHIGPMARSVGDIALMQNVMCGPHPRDIASLRPKVRVPTEYKSIKGWKIAYTLDLAGYDIEPDVIANTHRAIEQFRALGATVEEVDLGWKREEVAEAARGHFGTIFGPWIGRYAEAHRDLMTDYALAFAENARGVNARDFVGGLEIETKMYASFGPIMERYKVLLCPTLPLPATKAGESYVKTKLIINGKPQQGIEHWLMTICFNILSRCPVMSLPSGFAGNGVPTGLSIVGRTYDDATVFHAAAAYEKAMGGFYTTPRKRPKL
jgi:Asp-tRNA(Asn)/Glu-tRNA(Gln) amidotransferase A subunit family amidase